MPIFDFTVRAEDNNGNFADRDFQIEVLNTLRERIVVFDIGDTTPASQNSIIMVDDNPANGQVFNITSLPVTVGGAGGDTPAPRYAGGLFWVGSYSSPDGKLWTNRTADLPAGGQDFTISQLNDGNLYIARNQTAEFYTSTDQGANWTAFNVTGGTSRGYNTLAGTVNRLTGTTLALDTRTGTYIAAFAAGITLEIYRSTDGGATWTQVFTAANSSSIVFDYVVSEGGAFIVSTAPELAGPGFGGQFVSFDDGVTWSDFSSNIVNPAEDTRYFFGAPKYINGRWNFTVNKNITSSTSDAAVGLFYTSDFITFTKCTLLGDLQHAGNLVGIGNVPVGDLQRTQGRLFTMITNDDLGAVNPDRGIELAVTEDGVTWTGLDVGIRRAAPEIPFALDLVASNSTFFRADQFAGHAHMIAADDK